MANKQEHRHLRPQWAGRDVCEADHGSELDREAALNEFDGKLPRHEAEDKAYEGYKRKQHLTAAAHHLQGMKLAEAAGDEREGKKHGLMYGLHVKQLGHEPIGPVPKEVQQHLDAALGSEAQKFYSFKPHRGDIFVLDGLGKAEKTMAQDTEIQLDWERKDDSSGGHYEALGKSERALYRTWEVEHGARPSEHVLVKHDGIKQTTLGYFKTREEAMQKAASLAKEGQQLSLTPMGTPQTAKAENEGLAKLKAAMRGAGSAEGSASASSASSASSMGKDEASSSHSMSGSEGSLSVSRSDGETRVRARMDKDEASASASGSASSASGDNEGLARLKAAMHKTDGQPPMLAMSEKCAKCGTKADLCKCGNMGKAELCSKCGKASNLCKCSGMTKSEAADYHADLQKKEHEAKMAAGKEQLQKSVATGLPETHFFGAKVEGAASPEDLKARLHNIYVAAKAVLDGKK